MSEEEFTLSQQHDGPGEGSLPENSGEQWTLITTISADPVLCLQSSPDVTGVMLITNEGIPLQTTVDSETTVQVRDDSLWSSLLWSSHSILTPSMEA